VYVSGSAPVRSPVELPGCSGLAPDEDPNSALFRIEVIKVPLASPEKAAIVSSPRIFNDLDAPPRHAEPVNPDRPANANRPARRRTGPNQCHDITVYPEIGRAIDHFLGSGSRDVGLDRSHTPISKRHIAVPV
jgi:hypothetical protein